jgi:hypothetical protein
MASLPVGVTPGEIIERYPRLYHLTHLSNVDSIMRLGLLSTSALLDLFGIEGEARRLIEASNRRELVPIEHQTHGVAILRDQKPMDDSGLRRALRDGITPAEWYRLVNRHVFFWVDEARVERLLNARAYRTERHALIVSRSAGLIERYAEQVVLSPINTGATKPLPHPRGRDCFVPLPSYPFADWTAKRRGRDTVVEVAVATAVPDLMTFAERILVVGKGEPASEIWSSV